MCITGNGPALNGSGTLFNLLMKRASSTTGATTSLTWLPSPDNFHFTNPAGGRYAPVQTYGATVQADGAISIDWTVVLPVKRLSTTVPLATIIPVGVETTQMNPNHNLVGFQGDFTFDSS